MYVEVHPGQENKVLVNEIKKAIAVYMKSACDAEQRRIMEDNLYELTEKYSPNEVMDALYYACKDGKRMLDMQAEYFLAQLNGEKEEVPLSYSTYQRMYRKAFDFLGLTGRYTNHDFRSTFGTQLKESGMSSAMVADLMGHADTRMVETVYARSRHEGVMKQQNWVEKMNEKYDFTPSVAPEKTRKP